MKADRQNYQWIGKATAVLGVVLLYAVTYCGLRQHFTGNLVNKEGYTVIPEAKSVALNTTNRNSIFGPSLPLLPMKLNKAINVFFYPARKADLAATNCQMIFHVEFPQTPPHPSFFPTR